MPHTTFFCNWGDESDVATAQSVLQCVAEMASDLKAGGLLFVPNADVVVRMRRVHSVPLSCPPACLTTRRTNRSRCFSIDRMLDLRERRVLRRGVPCAKRVYRRLDWHPDDAPGAETCFVQLNGIATTSWRAIGMAHTVFQLCDPLGPSTGACMVVTPEDFMQRMEFYE